MPRFDFHPTGDRIEIPADFGDRLADVYGECPETVWEWWMLEGDRSEVTEDGLAEADFYRKEPTPHEVRVGDGDGDADGGYAPCALDALNAAAMADGRATVRSTDPVTDAVVTVRFSDEAVTVVPEEALISIGRDPDPDVAFESHDSIIDCADEVDEEAFVESVCRYGRAFESEDTYARWAAETEAVSFPASAEKIGTLLHRLHRSSRVTLVTGVAGTLLTDVARGVVDRVGRLTAGPPEG